MRNLHKSRFYALMRKHRKAVGLDTGETEAKLETPTKNEGRGDAGQREKKEDRE